MPATQCNGRKSWDDRGFLKSPIESRVPWAQRAPVATFPKEKFKRRMSDAICVASSFRRKFSTSSERPAEIIAFLGRHVPSSMAGPLFYLLYDMAPCRTPRASVAGDKVKLLRGWRVNASSLQVLGPARSFPKTEARYSYRDRMDDIVFGLRQDECARDC